MIDVPNPEMKLKPGMTANVTIQIAGSENVLRVPNSALRFRPTTNRDSGFGIRDSGDGVWDSGHERAGRRAARAWAAQINRVGVSGRSGTARWSPSGFVRVSATAR